MPIRDRRTAAAAAFVIALSGCQGGGSAPAPAPSVVANAVLNDLHLSTAAPPPLLSETPRLAAASTLAEPVILRNVQPAAPRFGANRSGPQGAGGGRGGDGAGTISLNFEKASLRTVIDAVLGDALDVPYTVDERIDGVVTLVSPRKLTRDQALDALEGVLQLNGAALIKGDTLYRVVLAANARQALPAPRAGAGSPGYAISVYVPTFTAAGSLQKLIEPLYQVAGAISADTEHNLLLITGSAEERRALLDAARMFDQDWLANQSVGIFPLHQARPRQVVDELKGLFSPTGAAAGGEAAGIRFSAIERLNAVMVVSMHASGLDRAAAWIDRLDQTGPGERTLHIYPVHYAQVQNLARLLTRLVASGGGESGNAALPPGTAGTRLSTVTTSTSTSTSGGAAGSMGSTPPSGQSGGFGAQGAGTGGGVGNGSAQGGSGFGSADHALSKDDDSDAAADDSGNGPRIIADSATHTLLVRATQAEARIIEEALTRLDAKPAQILIEATIVEVTLNKTLQYGVQYYLRGKNLMGDQQGSIGFTTASATGPLTGIAPGFNGVLGTLGNPSVVLSALDQVTDSKVLSSPQLLVTDSHEALLKVGTQTPLLTQQATSTLTAGAPLVSSVEYHDTGVILRVLPRTNEADMVSLDIAQEVSEVVPSASGTLTPDIDERRIESSVTVQSGQTVMLGGLISENNSLTRSGLPLIASVPVLGQLMGNTNDSRARTELIVFITPHVLHDNDDAQRLTDELMGRLRSMQKVLQQE